MTEPAIIFEDKSVLVINKPAGLAVHSDGFTPGPFLTTWLVRKYPVIQQVGDDPNRPGIVHRLDKDTSGIMIVAKTPPAFTFLKDQFKSRQVKKTYIALLVGEAKLGVGEEVILNFPIGRSGKDPRVRVASKKAYGKTREAETRFRVSEHLPGYTLVEASPITGRTHQLRAHFKAYQHPIACDELYGTGKMCPLGLFRQALHAASLALVLPNGESGAYSAPLPADMVTALEHLRGS